MPNQRLIEFWKLAANDFNLHIIDNYKIKLRSGVDLTAAIMIADIGGEHGMLVFTDPSEVSKFSDEIILAGFSYSVMSEPRNDEIYDKDSFCSLLKDWQ